MIIPVCEESPQDWSLSPLQQRSQWKPGVRLGWATHTRHKSQHTHAHKRRLELKRQHRESSTRIELKSLTQWTECTGTESGCFRMLSECLCVSSMRLGGPFYSPKAARSRWRPIKEGQTCLLSGGAPDSLVRHRTATIACPVPISFLFWHRRPLQLQASWRTGQSGALADRWCRPRVDRGLRDRPLRWRPLDHRTVRCTTGQSGEL
jgi:hypothetical protein